MDRKKDPAAPRQMLWPTWWEGKVENLNGNGAYADEKSLADMKMVVDSRIGIDDMELQYFRQFVGLLYKRYFVGVEFVGGLLYKRYFVVLCLQQIAKSFAQTARSLSHPDDVVQ